VCGSMVDIQSPTAEIRPANALAGKFAERTLLAGKPEVELQQ